MHLTQDGAEEVAQAAISSFLPALQVRGSSMCKHAPRLCTFCNARMAWGVHGGL